MAFRIYVFSTFFYQHKQNMISKKGGLPLVFIKKYPE
jgi:hypothetical protein